MIASLPDRVAQVQGTATRLIWLYGACRFLTAGLAILSLLVAIDYSLRLDHPLLRLLLSALAAGLVGLAFLRLLWPVLAYRPNVLGTAKQIERRYPQLADRLASAIAFSRQPASDPTAGSPALRHAVITQAEAIAAGLDFRSAIDNRAPRAMAVIAGLALLSVVSLAWLNPPLGSLGLSRLAMPWRYQPWPRRHELVVVDPKTRVAQGEDLEIQVVDRRGQLPTSVELIVSRRTSAGQQVETQIMQPLGDKMVARLERVRDSFHYRVRGGDDDTLPWTLVTVVEPPQLTELTVQVEPPSYTGLSTYSQARIVKALVGSKLRLQGRLDQPVHKAALRSETSGLDTPSIVVAAGGKRFAAPGGQTSWFVDRSGTLRLELSDASGLVLSRDTRIEIQATPDLAPTIAWEQPAHRDAFTPRALIPIRGLVKDDLALQRVQLHYAHGHEEGGETAIEMAIRAPAATQLQPPPESGELGAGDSRTLEETWDLAAIPGLIAGEVLAVRLTAEDSAGQITTTETRQLTILSDDELARQLAAAQGNLLSVLTEAAQAAGQSREQTLSLERSLSSGDLPGPSEADRLQMIHRLQRHLQELLGASPQGAEAQLAALATQLSTNRSQDAKAADRTAHLLKEVRRLNHDRLPAIDRALTAAQKLSLADSDRTSGGSQTGEATAIARQLRAAAADQDQVIQSLQAMIDTLAQWDSIRRHSRELEEIRTAEENLARETDGLRLRAIAAQRELSAADAALSHRLSEQQLDLARRLDKVQFALEQELAASGAAVAPSAQALARALNQARRLAIGSQMRAAAAQLTQRRFGESHKTQTSAIADLNQLITALAQEHEISGGAPQRLQELVAGLVGSQKLLLAETIQLNSRQPPPGPTATRKLAADQRRLAETAEQATPGLNAAPIFEISLQAAASAMRRASEMLESGQAGEPAQSAQQEAILGLDRILAALRDGEPAAADSNSPPPAASQPQPAGQSPAAQLRLLVQLQEEINRHTARLETERGRGSSWTPAQLAEYDALARSQARLAEVALKLLESSAAPEVPQ